MLFSSKDPLRIQSAKKTGIALTGGTVADIFTVSGGPILCYGIWLEITTAVSANACNANLESDPTTGSQTDITGAVDIQSAAQGDWFGQDGDSARAMVKFATGTALPCVQNDNVGMVIPAGGIDLALANSDPSTGECTAYMLYRPMEPGVVVTS